MDRPSGRFVLRIPPELHRQLKEESTKRGISLNQVCRERLQSATGSRSLPGVAFTRGIDRRTLETLVNCLKDQVRAILLFGSVARGEATPSSDLDLLLVLKAAVPVSRDLYRNWDEKIVPQLQESPQKLAPHFVSLPREPEEAGGLWYEVALEGIPLWEEGNAVSQFLRAVREAIARGRMLRRTSHGHPYWIKSRRRKR